MPVSRSIQKALGSSSMIRKMFEEGGVLKKKYGDVNVFDFSIGNPDIDPPEAFRKTLLRLATENAAGSHGYMPNAGYQHVRDALARKISREQGVALDGRCVIMSVGAAGALNVILKSILNPEDEVVVCKPYFMEYRAYTANHGGVLVEAEAAANFNLNVDAIQAALSDKTAAVLINSPNNPTGRVYPAETLEELSVVLLRHGKKTGRYPYLIADEPYRELTYDGIVTPPVLCTYPHSIVASSYSKNLSLPGERIGYIAVCPQNDDADVLINALIYATRVLGYVNAPALMQRCIAELVEVKAAVDIYANRRMVFKRVLDSAGLSYINPEGAFYIFCKVPAGGDDLAFVDVLKKHLILGVPGSAFGAPGWVRFAYCVNEDLINRSAGSFKVAKEQFLSERRA
ncbi:MAG: pyridoxal phosphate-dependent aminotransferase [Spirochaetaceae bacterium]|jgi:aspartate aminotransferase|nr:pyridoxal phosphate-dependent aminotransferase [Spirochaetaceae bacterium]